MWDRIRIYIIWYFVIPVMVYGSETWSVNGIGMKRLSTWDRLRKVHGTVVQQGIWRIRTNQELRKLCEYLDIIACIQKKRLEWFGHVVRMDQDI